MQVSTENQPAIRSSAFPSPALCYCWLLEFEVKKKTNRKKAVCMQTTVNSTNRSSPLMC